MQLLYKTTAKEFEVKFVEAITKIVYLNEKI